MSDVGVGWSPLMFRVGCQGELESMVSPPDGLFSRGGLESRCRRRGGLVSGVGVNGRIRWSTGLVFGSEPSDHF